MFYIFILSHSASFVHSLGKTFFILRAVSFDTRKIKKEPSGKNFPPGLVAV